MFKNYELNPKLLHETLENLKLALDNYERNYFKKTFKYSFDKDIKISMNITNRYINHLMGFDHEHVDTWISFISRHQYASLEWLKDFANSEEFISYYIFARKQLPYFNFAKINYKTSNFKLLDLKNDIVFLFEDNAPAYNSVNLGVACDDRVISLKVRNDGQTHFYAPVSLYVYDNLFASVRDIKNIKFPTRAHVKNCRMISLIDNYNDENKEDTLNKIKTLIK